MRTTLFLVLLMFAAPVQAQSDPTDELERAAREAAGRIIGALELLVKAVPQYKAPEIMPNGDIVIRRKRKDGEPGYPDPYDGPCEIDGELSI